jgi:hypothetical protein
MTDWYTEGLYPMMCASASRYWVHEYAQYTGHFVDDFGNMVRVYAPDENGLHERMS